MRQRMGIALFALLSLAYVFLPPRAVAQYPEVTSLSVDPPPLYDSAAEISIYYTTANVPSDHSVHIYRAEGGGWVDITSQIDPTSPSDSGGQTYYWSSCNSPSSTCFVAYPTGYLVEFDIKVAILNSSGVEVDSDWTTVSWYS